MSDYRNMSGLSYQPDKLKNVTEEEALKIYPKKHKDWELYKDSFGEWGFMHKQDLEPFDLEFEISYSKIVKLGISLGNLLGEVIDLNKLKLFSITWYNGSDGGFNY